MGAGIEGFERAGVAGPIDVLSSDEAAELLAELRSADGPAEWAKGWAVSSPAYHRIAQHPRLLEAVTGVLGPNVLLAGANLVERDPAQVHEWHVDVHIAKPGGHAVTAWIGLENTNADTVLHVVSGSHRAGGPPQQIAIERNTELGSGDERVLAWAREHAPDAEIYAPDITDGQALLVDGDAWHGSRHTGADVRTALLLHYVTPDKPVRHHGPGHEWPFEFFDDPKPPCLLIAGRDDARVNRIVPPPLGAGPPVSQLIHFDRDDVVGPPGWKPMPGFKGPTNNLPHLVVKHHRVGDGLPDTSTEWHDYEQVVVNLQGVSRFHLGDPPHPLAVDTREGTVIYLPSGTRHAMSASWNEECIQLDISWIGGAAAPAVPLGVARFDTSEIQTDSDERGERKRWATELLAGPTITAERLRCLVVDFEPGFQGLPDVDTYDAVLVVLRGRLRTLGAEIGPLDVALYGAGEEHRIEVVGDEPARAIVVELTGGHASSEIAGAAPDRPFAGQMPSAFRRRLVARIPRRARIALRTARRRWRLRSFRA